MEFVPLTLGADERARKSAGEMPFIGEQAAGLRPINPPLRRRGGRRVLVPFERSQVRELDHPWQVVHALHVLGNARPVNESDVEPLGRQAGADPGMQLRLVKCRYSQWPITCQSGQGAEPAAVVSGSVIEDAYQALMAVGHSPVEARNRLDRVLTGGRTFESVEEILTEIYKQK